MRASTVAQRVLLLALVLFVLIGCKTEKISEQSTRRFSDKTRTEVHAFFLDASEGTLSLRIKATASDGEISWMLTDPAGNGHWSGKLGPGEIDETRSFDARFGKWQVTMRLRNATGNYDMSWRAGD